MASRSIRYLTLSQLCFFIFVILCISLMPDFLFSRDEGGISNFGVHRATILPFTLAFLGSSLLILKAARFIPSSSKLYNRLRYGLYILACLILSVLASTYPYKLNKTLDNLHILIGLMLFYYEMGFAIWLTLVVKRKRVNFLLLIIQSLGFFMGLLTLINVIHLLFVAQVITSLGFGLLIIYSVGQLMQSNDSKH